MLTAVIRRETLAFQTPGAVRKRSPIKPAAIFTHGTRLLYVGTENGENAASGFFQHRLHSRDTAIQGCRESAEEDLGSDDSLTPLILAYPSRSLDEQLGTDSPSIMFSNSSSHKLFIYSSKASRS